MTEQSSPEEGGHKAHPNGHPNGSPNTPRLLSPTFDVEYTDMDGRAVVYTFRKASCKQVLQWDDAKAKCQSGMSDADTIRLLTPLIDNQLEAATEDGEAIDTDCLEMTFVDMVNLFILMGAGADCSYDSKKDYGSPSPSDGDVSTPTTDQDQ